MMHCVFVLSDFGCRDTYSGQMKAALLRVLGEACFVDLTPGVPPGDIRTGAFHLMVSVPHIPPGSGVLAVIDPGVGTSRRILAATSGGAVIVAPDNGLLGWLELDDVRVVPSECSGSMTFHGRDLLAPALGRALEDPEWLGSLPVAAPGTMVILPRSTPRMNGNRIESTVAHIDVFGNCILWLVKGDLHGMSPVELLNTRGSSFQLRRAETYCPAGHGLLLLEGSCGLMEIALSGGSASHLAGLEVGDTVVLRCRN